MSKLMITKNSEKRLNDQIYFLKKAKMDFTVTDTTGTTEVTFWENGKQKTYFYLRGEYEDGEYLVREICRAVKNDVKKYLTRKGSSVPKYKWGEFFTNDFDPRMINSMCVGDIIKEIDINKCYWTWAFRLGYISYDTFIKYLPFKSERLIALGNLAKYFYTKEYSKGRIIGNPKRHQHEYAPFFYSIIEHTWKVYCEIGKVVGPKIYAFKTDAFFVPPSVHIENKIAKVLDQHGFEFKVNSYKVESISSESVLLLNRANKEHKVLHLTRGY